jgi:hypothetical protein
MGEDLLSNKFSAQKVESGLKVMLYNQFMNLKIAIISKLKTVSIVSIWN